MDIIEKLEKKAEWAHRRYEENKVPVGEEPKWTFHKGRTVGYYSGFKEGILTAIDYLKGLEDANNKDGSY